MKVSELNMYSVDKDIVNIIHLPHREDRLNNLKAEAKSQKDFNYQLWEGVISTTPAKGINQSHCNIVRWAKENSLPYVIIAEDDLVFSCPDSWQYFLSKLPPPNQYDLFLGMVYSADIEDGKITNGFSGLTMYSVPAHFFDFFLSIPDHVHLDRHLGMTAFEHRYLVCEPMVCLQTGGYTDNLKREMHYKPYLDDKEFLGQPGKVFDKGVWYDK